MGWMGEGIVNLFYPRKCVFCRKLLRRHDVHICVNCHAQLPIYMGDVGNNAYITQIYPVMYYENLIRQSLLRFKFGGQAQYGKCYGVWMAAKVKAKSETPFDYVCWVPISKKRRRERSYDQGYLLAKEVAEQLQVPLLHALVKIRNNTKQSTVGSYDARKANVLGVYKGINVEKLKEKRLLLVDDIMTTGATCSEAARVLLSEGAKEVCCSVFAIKLEK